MEKVRFDFPKHTKPLVHQVAGHIGKDSKLAFLECGDGTILKPLQNNGRGDCEVSFYRSVYHPSCSNPVLLGLRPLLPGFFGALTSPDEPNVTYIRLEDAAAGLRRPCLLDIKMGARTYDPLADAAKIAREEAKYPPSKKIGFQLRGMRIYNRSTDTFQKHGKEYLRTFNEDTVGDALGMFFTNGHGLRRNVVSACLIKLQRVVEWFEKQKELSFYASSILIAYDGADAEKGPFKDPVNNSGNIAAKPLQHTSTFPQKLSVNGPEMNIESNLSDQNSIDGNSTIQFKDSTITGCPIGTNEDTVSSDLVKLFMIDFTHVFPLNGKERDENYFFGLQNLVKYCQGILE